MTKKSTQKKEEVQAKKLVPDTQEPEVQEAPMADVQDEQQDVATQVQGTEEVDGLWIESISEQGRVRAGIKWTREGTGIALSALTDEQIIALKNDPMLRVSEATFPVDEVVE